jgi:heat shock protein HtpX
VSRLGRFSPDRQLTTRMLLVVLALGLLYVVAIAALVAYGVNPVLVLLVAAGFLAFQYFASEGAALRALGAREVTPQEEPDLHAVVDRLCALSDTPKPRVAVARSDVPNAFATGRSPDRALVCVTTGLQRRLEPDELEGVLAHELSHVAHRDVAVMTVASFLGVLAGIVARNALRGMHYTGGRRDGRTLPILVAVVLVSAVVYAVSFVLLRALSRYRELSADRTAAQLTGRPSSLASALTKVSGEMARVPTRDLREAEPFNAFFFAPALAGGLSFSSLFATHPPLERRIEQLARMSGQL